MVDFFDVKIAVGMEGVEQHQAEQIVRQLPRRKSSKPLKKAQKFLLAGKLHQVQHRTKAGVGLLTCGIKAGEIEQCVLELGQERQQVSGQSIRQCEEVLEGGRYAPSFRSLMEDEGKNWWERQAFGFVMLDEDFRQVSEQAQGHGRIRTALVLEEEIEKSLTPGDVDREQKVGVDLLEAGFDE